MAKNARIRLEQITRAKKLLQNLPEKENIKTREEAATLLKKDFIKAAQKGYTPREISLLLKSEGIPIPAILLKTFIQQKTEQETCTKITESTANNTDNHNFIVPDTPNDEL